MSYTLCWPRTVYQIITAILLLLVITSILNCSLLTNRLNVLLWMVILNEQLALHSIFLNIHKSDVVTVLFGCYMASAMWNCCCLSACSLYTIQPCNILQCHFMQNHKHWVHAHFAVTSHLPTWQNDWDLLHDAVVTQGGMVTEMRLST